MGLDIGVVKNAKLLKATPKWSEDFGDRDEAHFISAAAPEYAGRLDGMESGFYSGDWGESFRAGSYSGYNQWREWLCKAALGCMPESVWNGEHEGESFVELIDFSDCEGAIGPKTSRKLLADFVEREAAVFAAAAEFLNEADMLWFKDRYAHWKRAFSEAAETQGFVVFQ